MSRLRLQASLTGDLETFMAAEIKAAESAVTAGMTEATDGLKREIREQVTGAGLGTRLANTVRGTVYPRGQKSLDAAGLVYTKAPKLLEVFERGATIVPKDGSKYLAIPTANVPRKAGGRGRGKMTPVEVEATFNQDLKFAKAGNGRLIAYVDALGAKSGKGYRRATARRLKSGRSAVSVVMFVMIPVARLRKRLDIQGAGERWAGRLDSLIVKNWRDVA